MVICLDLAYQRVDPFAVVIAAKFTVHLMATL